MEHLNWVVLTRGDRRPELQAAVASLGASVLVVVNGAGDSWVRPSVDRGVSFLELETNVGVPAGRDVGLRSGSAALVGFLDDDAVARGGISEALTAAFVEHPELGAVALRIVDEQGMTARRHVPRLGGRGAEAGGVVAVFLGGACVIRREAYEDAGGYWSELFYGHEEVELSWRLVDRGWKIEYRPDLTVFHPRTEIGRHAEGWRMTGRNRVMIARRTLPWPVALVHVSLWLVLGLIRSPRAHRRSYLEGWIGGWRHDVEHRPIRWRSVWRLTKLGRPPIL